MCELSLMKGDHKYCGSDCIEDGSPDPKQLPELDGAVALVEVQMSVE
jgi:hypothetical protein